MLRGFFLLHYVHHLIFRCVLFVSSGLEFVLFQSLHQYLLCAPVDLYFSEDAQLGQYGACRQPLYRCVFCQRLSEKTNKFSSTGSFIRWSSLCRFSSSIFCLRTSTGSRFAAVPVLANKFRSKSPGYGSLSL